jgi:hypothetical protein
MAGIRFMAGNSGLPMTGIGRLPPIWLHRRRRSAKCSHAGFRVARQSELLMVAVIRYLQNQL